MILSYPLSCILSLCLQNCPGAFWFGKINKNRDPALILFCFPETWGKWREDLNEWFLVVLSAFKNNNTGSVPRTKYSYLHGHARRAPRNVLEIHGTKFHTEFYVAYKLVPVTLPFPLERRYLLMLLFDSQNQIRLFLVMVVNIPAARHVLSLLQSLFQLMERWESMPKWDLNYVLTERVDQGKGRQSGLYHMHLKPPLKFMNTF